MFSIYEWERVSEEFHEMSPTAPFEGHEKYEVAENLMRLGWVRDVHEVENPLKIHQRRRRVTLLFEYL